ncbi:MAG: hypothetical protein AABO57_24295 [Acidobacteriota bacterium]
MTKMRLMLNMLAVFAVCLLCSSMAQAQACRTWVSGVGDDANPCSRTAPCKTFAGAISKTAEGGEIDALDPGGFGSVTITKSITIDGTYGAGFGSILASGVTGVIVNVTTNAATSKVTLRNLSINGTNGPGTCAAGVHGISFIAGKSLHVQHCDIFGFGQNGINVNKTLDGTNITVQDTTIRECTGSGISVTTSVGNVAAVITGGQIDKCGVGVSSATNAVVTISHSNLALNTTGVNTASNSQTNVTDTLFANHTTGINVVSGATVRVNNDIFANNLTGIQNAGTVNSAGNNKFMGNLANTAGAAFGAALAVL